MQSCQQLIKVVEDLPNLPLDKRAGFKTESIILKVKIGKAWETLVGIYRPPTSAKVPKSAWTLELESTGDHHCTTW